MAFSFAVNYATGRLETLHYHLTNLAIHIVAGLTLFGILRRTFTLPCLSARYGTAATPLAFAVAAVWTLHPLQTGAVTYLVQRYESLMGMFYLLSLYCAIRSASSPRARWWASASVAACLLAMGSKEVAVSIPLMILLYDRAFLAGSFKECWRQRRGLYIGLAGTWVAFGLLFHFSASRSRWAGFTLPISALEYARSQFGVILHYLRLSFWPYPQVFDYAWPVANTVAEILPGAAVVGGLLALTIYALIRWPKWGALGAWFFLILAPSSSVLPIADLAFEHRMYLSLAAVAAAAVIAAYELLERLSVRLAIAPRTKRWLQIGPVVVLLLAWGCATYLRNQMYESNVSVWYDVVDKAPHNGRAYYNLGLALCKQECYSEAGACFQRAIELEPQSPLSHAWLGTALSKQGRTDEALAQFRKALEIDPRCGLAHHEMAIVLCSQGKMEEGIAEFREALKIDPADAVTHCNLSQALARQGKVQEAIAHYQKALEFGSEDAEVQSQVAQIKRSLANPAIPEKRPPPAPQGAGHAR